MEWQQRSNLSTDIPLHAAVGQIVAGRQSDTMTSDVEVHREQRGHQNPPLQKTQLLH